MKTALTLNLIKMILFLALAALGLLTLMRLTSSIRMSGARDKVFAEMLKRMKTPDLPLAWG